MKEKYVEEKRQQDTSPLWTGYAEKYVLGLHPSFFLLKSQILQFHDTILTFIYLP